ncbi:FeoA family protein [Peptoniphilus equinus]|uniref:FeoA family protein n=1 Tax=Peptoniphilus equinus TaxID=3016343 RepID=A0ABY7QTP5_9FIRM|nr:FeoA family protein [Peptoniphilus equinus]WBW49826.1 FeoA family protein [Peptoniphilus equinus]
MLSLLMAPMNRELKIVKIKTKKLPGDFQTKHLNNLGFIEGSTLKVVSENAGNLIVNIKGSRVAIGKDVAAAFMVGE